MAFSFLESLKIVPRVLRFCRYFKVNCVSNCCNGNRKSEENLPGPSESGESGRGGEIQESNWSDSEKSNTTSSADGRVHSQKGIEKAIQTE